MTWTAPSLQVRWGPYYRPDVAEQKQLVDMVRAALAGDGGPMITLKHAVQKISNVFDIENIDAVIEEIKTETDARANRELDAATAALGKKAGTGRPDQDAEVDGAAPDSDSGRPEVGQDDTE